MGQRLVFEWSQAKQVILPLCWSFPEFSCPCWHRGSALQGPGERLLLRPSRTVTRITGRAASAQSTQAGDHRAAAARPAPSAIWASGQQGEAQRLLWSAERGLGAAQRSGGCHSSQVAPSGARATFAWLTPASVRGLGLLPGVPAHAADRLGWEPLGNGYADAGASASLNGRTLLQARQFTAKYAVNICSAQENDFNCIIKLVVDAASGQNDGGEERAHSCPSEFVDCGDGLRLAGVAGARLSVVQGQL